MTARFWAKTGKGEFVNGKPEYHPVICHLADTAAVAMAIVVMVRAYMSLYEPQSARMCVVTTPVRVVRKRINLGVCRSCSLGLVPQPLESGERGFD
ncbi:MAG: HD domain-containing protein [Cyanobacteria bacterium]|nr:HD domain-containing protein [Cyanobacteriota bacterium]